MKAEVTLSNVRQLQQLSELFPDLKNQTRLYRCPRPRFEYDFSSSLFCDDTNTLEDMITHWNDHHGLSFDQIADELDRLPVDLSVKEK